jgi:2-keto-4-pentenoate hydratase/2-oxohepta-3-ene-1,7-dioic acid hydratase in catechol pathway
MQAPIPRPFRHIICLGKNYEEHAKELLGEVPKAPVYFTKTACPAMGDGAKIPLHEHLTQKVDYEVELAVIIGKTAAKVTPQAAEEVIFGYTILNDITARDLQAKHEQWFLAKSLDGFAPLGPHIVTRDEIPNPAALTIKSHVNDELRQSSTTANLIFTIPQIISNLSQALTLHPGDIIATGTPAGVGHALSPPQYLKPGDKVKCEIENIGTLTNFF